MIEVNHLVKEYHISKRESGLKNAFKALFVHNDTVIKALNDVSFKIDFLCIYCLQMNIMGLYTISYT